MAPSSSEGVPPAKKQKVEVKSTCNEAGRIAILEQGQDSVESLKDNVRGPGASIKS